MFDVLQYASDHGYLLTAFILLILVLAYVGWRHACGWTSRMDTLIVGWDDILAKVKKEIEDGGIAGQNHSLIEKFREEFGMFQINLNAIMREHIEESHQMASEEHWKHCPIDRCPHLKHVISMVENYRDMLDKNIKEAREAREVSREAIERLSAKLESITRELLVSLRQIAGLENGNWKKSSE